jgi:hypothetical protein
MFTLSLHPGWAHIGVNLRVTVQFGLSSGIGIGHCELALKHLLTVI